MLILYPRNPSHVLDILPFNQFDQFDSGLDSNSNSNPVDHNFRHEYEASIRELAVNSISAVHVSDEA